MTYVRTTAVHQMQPMAGVLKSTPMLLLLLIGPSGAVMPSIVLGPWGFQAFLPHGAKLVQSVVGIRLRRSCRASLIWFYLYPSHVC